jgi:Ca2+-transporting ATPase
LQILFINLITDVLPALALGVGEGGDEIMQKPPRKMNEPIIDRKRWNAIFFYSIVIATSSIGAVLLSHYTIHQTETWNPVLCNNIMFFTLIFSQLLHVFNMGTTGSGFFSSEIMRNKYVWLSVIFSLAALFLIHQIIPAREVLGLHEMSMADWSISLGAGLLSLLVIQTGKKLKIIRQ